MKAFTIYQPWASLVIVGAKPYEFRSWSPRERGGAYAALIGERVVIHASAKMISRQEILDLIRVLNHGGDDAKATCLHAEKAMPILERALDKDLAWAAGLGTAVLGEPKNGLDVAHEFGLPYVNDSERRKHANFGWPMVYPERWPEPVPMRGFQGFWNWPTPEDIGL